MLSQGRIKVGMLQFYYNHFVSLLIAEIHGILHTYMSSNHLFLQHTGHMLLLMTVCQVLCSYFKIQVQGSHSDPTGLLPSAVSSLAAQLNHSLPQAGGQCQRCHHSFSHFFVPPFSIPEFQSPLFGLHHKLSFTTFAENSKNLPYTLFVPHTFSITAATGLDIKSTIKIS